MVTARSSSGVRGTIHFYGHSHAPAPPKRFTPIYGARPFRASCERCPTTVEGFAPAETPDGTRYTARDLTEAAGFAKIDGVVLCRFCQQKHES